MKNGKFEVGDIVAGKEKKRVAYRVTNPDMTRARVTSVYCGRMCVEILEHADSRYVGCKFDVVNDPDTFQLAGITGDDYPDSAVLVITRNGTELTADLAADGKLASAKAVCSPYDSFSIHNGVGLLLERLGFPKPAEQSETEAKTNPGPAPYKPQVGDLVRVTRLPRGVNNGGLQVGDLTPVVAFSLGDKERLYVSCPEKSDYIGDGADRPVCCPVMLLDRAQYELIERQPGRW